MQRYESYKPSGTPWLGDIPTHWNIQPLIAIATKKSICNCPEKELLSVYLDRGVIKFSDVDEKRTNATSEDLSKYQEVLPGDFVLNNQQAWRGSVGVSEYEGIVSPAYIVLRLKKDLNPRFANYLFRDGSMVSQYLICSKGVGTIQRNLYWPQLKRSRVIIPPQEEQNRIVAFLDQKTAEIDAAIAKKERLIELLQEQKKIIRNQVITKGLNLSALQCDSGVPWIGAIPSHWKVCAIKRLFKSMDYGLSESALDDGYFKYLNMGHIKDGNVSTENTGYLESAPNALLLRKNDILFNRTNSFDLVGKSGIYLSDEENITFASYMVRIRVKDEICPNWANSLMNSESYLSFIRTLALRSLNQANLNPTRLGAVSVPVPPKEEQEAIADYLDEMSTQVDISIRSIEKELCGLFEMKQTTIANVVTGKIKV